MESLNDYFPSRSQEDAYREFQGYPGSALGDLLGDKESDMPAKKSPFLRPINKALPKEQEKPSREISGAPKAATKTVGKTGSVRSNYPGEAKGIKRNPTQANSSQAQKAKQMEPDQQAVQDQDVQDPVQVPGSPKHADPNALAAQLGTTVDVLKRVAMRFRANAADKKIAKKPGSTQIAGRAGFISFMQTRLNRVVEKHNLDDDYLGLIYDALTVA